MDGVCPAVRGERAHAGLTAIVQAFRRDRTLHNAGDKAKAGQGASKKKKGGDIDWPALSSRVTLANVASHIFTDQISEHLLV